MVHKKYCHAWCVVFSNLAEIELQTTLAPSLSHLEHLKRWHCMLARVLQPKQAAGMPDHAVLDTLLMTISLFRP